jgi:hypothetical protein
MVSLNIYWPVEKAKAAFTKFDDEKDGELHFHQFVRLYAHVCVPPLLVRKPVPRRRCICLTYVCVRERAMLPHV